MQITPDEILISESMVSLFIQLNGDEKGAWGKMNPWQAVEHLADVFDASANKKIYNIVTPAEQLPKYVEFLRSEKEFRENTKAPEIIMGEEPAPVTSASYTAAIERLQTSAKDFFNFFKNYPAATSIHPVFGNLNYADWLKLHGKHARHHLRQFGLLNS